MKYALIAGVLLASNAFATTIDLPPGSQAVINPGDTALVRCGGPASNIPRCSIVADNDSYDIKQGNDVIATMNTLSGAIAEVQDLRKAGVCP